MLDEYESRKERRRMNELLFWPLTNHLVRTSPDFPRLEQYIIERNFPENSNQAINRSGFVMESLVKMLLMEFCENPDSGLSVANIGNGEIGGVRYKTNAFGNVELFEMKNKESEAVAELDGLYEFGDEDKIIPVILEVKLNVGNIHSKDKKGKNKRELINKFYTSVPYYLKVFMRHKSVKRLGFYEDYVHPYQRIVIMRSYNDEIEKLSKELRGLAEDFLGNTTGFSHPLQS